MNKGILMMLVLIVFGSFLAANSMGYTSPVSVLIHTSIVTTMWFVIIGILYIGYLGLIKLID